MKLALIGGGGVRSPLFVISALRRVGKLPIEELCLMDIEPRRLEMFGGLCQELVHRAGDPFKLTLTTDPRRALTGARHVVTTIRVGFEQGRALDERIALRQGVLGQETTGPGGFAMALRSIPAILEYAALLEEVSPGAWMYSFTNPAGLVAQALRNAGYKRTVGICDGANGGQNAVAGWLGVPHHSLRAEVFGLNHLSWTRRVWHNGREVLGELLANPEFVRTMLGIFEPELVAQTGMHLNEYLYYFHYAEKAVTSLLAEPHTRGEELVELNRKLMDTLEQIDVRRNPQAALEAFFAYEQRRGATYMYYARSDAPTPEQADAQAADRAEIPEGAGEGYAGVALDIIQALEGDEALFTALNVPNAGAIEGMLAEDVVEVSCRVDRNGITSLPIGAIPAPQLALMQAVKHYERLTVQAALTRSRRAAIAALMAHPLVLSYSRASRLVDDYLQAHAPYVGDWTV